MKIKRVRKRIYDEEVMKALARIWWIMDYPCGKGLVPVLPDMIEKLKNLENGNGMIEWLRS